MSSKTKIKQNIYRRKDGRWEGRAIQGRNPDGKIRYAYCYGKEREEVSKKLESLPAPTDSRHADSFRFEEAARRWLRIKSLEIKPSTYAKYQITLDRYLIPEFGCCTLGDITQTFIEEFLLKLLLDVGLAKSSVQQILILLKSVLRYGYHLQGTEMPSYHLAVPKADPVHIRVLSRQEQKKMTEYLENDLSLSHFAIYLALSTGLRIGELCGLKWEDVNLEEGVLHVRHTLQRLNKAESSRRQADQSKTHLVLSSPKTDKGHREIPLSSKVLNLCREMKQDGQFYVASGTSKPLDPRTLQYRFASIVKECGLKDVHFHTLRHTFATRCVEEGFDPKCLSEILGHSSVKITLDLYVHISMDVKRQNMEKAAQAF